MGGSDILLSSILKNEIEKFLSKKVLIKLERRLFEKHNMTLTETMCDFKYLDDVLSEFFGRGSKGIIRSILKNVCKIKTNTRKNDNIIILHDPQITENIVDILGDRDYRNILEQLMDKPLTAYEMLDKISIPMASFYRKIQVLVNMGLLVESEKIQGKSGRPAIKLETLYRGLDFNIVQNKITVKIKISQNMMKKSTVLNSLYNY